MPAVVENGPLFAACRVCDGAMEEAGTCGDCLAKLIDLGFAKADDAEASRLDLASAAEYAVEAASADRYAHYEILTQQDGSPWELGRGAMGVTYKAYDTGLQCAVALKLINSQAFSGAGATARFLLEARTAAKLRHANIASVYHLGSRNGVWFYSMEFIEGETLFSLVERNGPLPWSTALNVATQVARALVVAHEQAFIHRDIKPSNIMLAAAPVGDNEGLLAKLIDFGLVKPASDLLSPDVAATAYFVGTPQFASPEQMEVGQADVRSDIYSLGATLFYMLTGFPPDSKAMFEDGFATNLAQAPTSLVELLGKMLSSDPALRPQSASILLSECIRCASVQAAPPPDRVLFKHARLIALSAILLTCIVFAWRSTFMPHQESTVSSSSSSLMPPSQNIDAYTAQIRADEHYLKITEEDNRQAIELYSRAISIDPNYALAHSALAEAYGQGVRRGWLPRERMKDALLSARKAVALCPDAAKSHFALGAVYAMQEMQRKSLEQLHRALEIDLTYEPAMRAFGLSWVMVGAPEKGLPWLKAAAEREPSSVKGWISIADAYKDLGDDADAEATFEKARQLEPTRLGAIYGLIHLNILRGKFEDAQWLCDKGLALRPDDMFAQSLSAQIALFKGDFTRAEELYRGLLSRNRTGDLVFYGSVRYLSALAFIASKTGRAREAEEFGREAESLDREAGLDGPQGIFDLAALQAGRGQTAEAVKTFEEAVARGWLDYRAVYMDPRFANLRAEPAFLATVGRLQQRIEEARREAVDRCARPLVLSDYPPLMAVDK